MMTFDINNSVGAPPPSSSLPTPEENRLKEVEQATNNVQPSSMLINILHHKLRDPSIVPTFERHYAHSHLLGRLVRPRWMLKSAAANEQGEDMVADKKEEEDDEKATDVPNGEKQHAITEEDDTSISKCTDDINSSLNDTKQSYKEEEKESRTTTKYNTIPKRNYINLRMEQNALFANNQHLQCQQMLSKLYTTLHPQTSINNCDNNDRDNGKQWMKQADTIQQLLNEGLAACPNHEGLLSAEKQYKEWIQRRIHGLSVSVNRGREDDSLGVARSQTTSTDPTSKTNNSRGSNNAYLPNQFPASTIKPKKGAEGRAQMAMKDALLERSFLLGNGTTGEKDESKNKYEEDDDMYPLLSINDDRLVGVREDVQKNAATESYKSRSDIEDDDSQIHDRRKKRSKHKHKRHKRKKSRRSSHDDDRKRTKKREPSSRLLSSEDSDSSSSYRRKRYRRKEKKRRKKKKSYRESCGTRYSSEEDKDGDCKQPRGEVLNSKGEEAT